MIKNRKIALELVYQDGYSFKMFYITNMIKNKFQQLLNPLFYVSEKLKDDKEQVQQLKQNGLILKMHKKNQR